MALGKQAKVLTDAQIKTCLTHIQSMRAPQRNTVMFLLSVDAGLRAKEIASITWEMVTDATGNLTDTIRLEDKASKGSSGGVVYMSRRLVDALEDLRASVATPRGTIITSERTRALMSPNTVVCWFAGLYHSLGFEGCSSHSGRRTAITKWARKISSVGGSLRDVQALARHSSLQMTQRYIEVSEDAMRKVVG
jgi:integrase